MKNRLFFLGVLCLCLVACSVEKVMEQDNNLNVILLETVVLPEKHVGDTISFKVFAGTNDIIERMEITEATHDFSGMLLGNGVRYEIIEDTLYADSEGYFNRPVSSVVVNYPIIVDVTLLRQIAGLNFTFHTDRGVIASARAQVKVVNYKLHENRKDVYGLVSYSELEEKNLFQGYPFYASDLNQTYPLIS